MSGQAWFKPAFEVSRLCLSSPVSRTLNKGFLVTSMEPSGTPYSLQSPQTASWESWRKPTKDEKTESACGLLPPCQKGGLIISFAITRQGEKTVMSITCHWTPVVSWCWQLKGKQVLLEDSDLDEKVAWLLGQKPSLSLRFTPSGWRCHRKTRSARAF